MIQSKCKICRRLNEKLFLKGDRCYSQKCAMVKRAYAPGQKPKRTRRRPSEYSRQLTEKQKLKKMYNLREAQFKKYVIKVLNQRSEKASDNLISLLESRLDSVVFRLGFGFSKIQAKQLVSHGSFLVNGKPVNIPSYQLKEGESIKLKTQKRKNKNIESFKSLMKQKPVDWVEFDPEKMEGKITHFPTLEEVSPPVKIQAIFEFYSK